MDLKGHHQRVTELFLAACDMPAEERSRFLDEACAGNESLRSEIEQMLVHDDGEAFVDQSAMPTTIRSELEGLAELPARLPERIGRYEILAILGEGGMGTVYRAQQDNPRRIVALKVIRPDMTSRGLIRRFEFEAQILGRLRHPGIAQIHEAGTAETDRGLQPYFAMELIEGQPLPQYARENDCDARERLSLVASICDAVHHAHQNGIIHRDLKPGNILVDSTGKPSVLDFGVARITDSDIKSTTVNTGVGQLLGTVPYMSPEQIRGHSDEIDARSDVYALGVVAYELLAGELPFHLREVSLPEAVRIIQDEEPSRLSTISRYYRGDVETIVAKALEKDPERRYQAASELAADIRRFLDDEPIVARPPSLAYQISKFARRHRAFVFALASVFVILVAALAVSITFAVIADNRRADAEEMGRQLTKANADLVEESEKTLYINAFLNRMLETANPYGEGDTSGREVTVVEMLDHAAETIGESFVGHPDVEAVAHTSIAGTYKGLNRFEEALNHYMLALERNTEYHGRLHKINGVALRGMAVVNTYLGHTDLAREQITDAIELQRELYGGDHRELVTTLGDAAWIHTMTREDDEAEAFIQEATVLAGRLDDFPPEELAILSNNYGQILRRNGQPEEAAQQYRLAMGKLIELYGEAHPYVASAKNNLALTLNQLGERDEAAKLYAEAIEINRAATGGNKALGDMYNNLGSMYHQLEKYAESEEAYNEALAIYERILGSPHRELVGTLDNLGLMLIDKGELDKALDTYINAADQSLVVFGEENWRHRIYRFMSGYLTWQLGNLEDGRRLMEQHGLPLLADEESIWARAYARSKLIELYEAVGEPEKADLYREPNDG